MSVPAALGTESFEQANHGKFTTLSTTYGPMSCRDGVAEIGGGGKSGKSSLRMFGGQDTELKLDLQDTPSREVRLSAWAERLSLIHIFQAFKLLVRQAGSCMQKAEPIPSLRTFF